VPRTRTGLSCADADVTASIAAHVAPIIVHEIGRIIRELAGQGMTILLAEQNAAMALGIADRAYVLETGRVSLEGTGAELADDDAVRRNYLGG